MPSDVEKCKLLVYVRTRILSLFEVCFSKIVKMGKIVTLNATQPMDCSWVGYLYDNPSGPPIQAQSSCFHPTGVEASTYIDDSGYLTLKVGPLSRFCNAFELHYQGHYKNATLGLHYGGYEVTATVP